MRHVFNLQSEPFTEVDVAVLDKTVNDAGTLSHAVHSRPQSFSDTDMRKLREIRDMRARRARLFSDDLFSDPAWDMLAALALAELEQRRVSISDLSAEANVPATTALRWIASMTEMKHFVRSPDPLDQRRFYISLSNKASASMRSYLSAAYVG